MTHQNELPIGLTQRLAELPTPNVAMRRPARSGITIAIDPGASGGFAIQYPDGKIDLEAMPDTDAERLTMILTAKDRAGIEGVPISAVMEQVGGYIRPRGKDGGAQPGSAMFNFGEGFGFLRGALLALGIPLRMVRPQQWQKGLCLGAPCNKPARKRALKAKAQEMFPALKPTLKTCDALLILDWANRCL
jgi:hypothetical protein